MTSGTCGENLTWNLTWNDTLTISGTGKMENYSFGQKPSWASHKYSINEVIIKDGVTTIGDCAFDGYYSLTAITIPEGVTTIGNYAFSRCESLTAITIPEGITTIGGGAFSYCSSLTAITIPEGVKTIGGFAFSCCKSLTAITIPEGVKTIGGFAFSCCKSLTAITIPEGVTTIGGGAFSYCSSLTAITIPESVTTIGDAAFCGCESLQEITIPYGLKKLGENVLLGCTSLKKIYYRAGSDFEEILSEDNNAQLIPVERLDWKIENITLTVGGVTEIKDYSREEPAWVDSLNVIQKIIIEEGLQKISANAFSNCLKLEHLTIPASVTTIGDFAFTISYCGERTINGGKNVIWSLDDGVLMIKKNPAANADADFSIGDISWQVIDKNIKRVKIERGVIPDRSFFEWLNHMDEKITFSI